MEITKSELNKILTNHKHWLLGDVEGWKNMKADLQNVNLSGADLRGINLKFADLSYANLSYARLEGANFQDVDLHGAILYGTNLSNTYLENADLQGVDLTCANLQKACLKNANLFNANLCETCLAETNLQDAYLQNANLAGADLSEATGGLIEFRKGKVLTEPLIGYKKCQNKVIVTLEIPKYAVVFSINGHKCRTNMAKVIAVDGADVGISGYNGMPYHVGDEIVIDNFNCEYNLECATGIHFFTNREDAEKYLL